MQKLHEQLKKSIHGGAKAQAEAKGTGPIKHENLANQTRAECEDYALRMVEKKHTRQQVIKLMRLSFMENGVTKDQKKEVEYRQLL